MFVVCKEYTFEASHHLPLHDGKCRRLHGHHYKVEVQIGSYDLATSGPKTGMVLDFSDLDAIVRPIVDGRLDHRDLNEVLAGEVDHPTAENLARWLHDQINPPLLEAMATIGSGRRTWLVVRVWETPKAFAEYR